MVGDIDRGNSVLGIDLKHLLYKLNATIGCIFEYLGAKFVFSFFNFFKNFFTGFGFERKIAMQNFIKDDAKCPNVH
jgi:hypothetical protein